jgi:hypothetical protein
VPLTPNGNATERHICEAYSQGRAGRRGVLEIETRRRPADAEIPGAHPRQDDEKGRRRVTCSRARASFPLMADMNRFVLESGAIPTLTWLDGTSEGEKAIEELFPPPCPAARRP